MNLTHLSAEHASILMQEINVLNQTNRVLPGKLHRYFGQNFNELQKITQPFRDKVEATKKEYNIELLPDGKGGNEEKFDKPELKVEFNNKVKEILSAEVKVPLLKLAFADVENLGFPSNFNFNNFYNYMVDGAPKPEKEEKEKTTLKLVKA